MLSITRLFAAVATLADNLAALASTVAEANGQLRARLTLDPAETAVLTHQPAQDGPGGSPEGNGSAERSRRGRKAQGAA